MIVNRGESVTFVHAHKTVSTITNKYWIHVYRLRPLAGDSWKCNCLHLHGLLVALANRHWCNRTLNVCTRTHRLRADAACAPTSFVRRPPCWNTSESCTITRTVSAASRAPRSTRVETHSYVIVVCVTLTSHCSVGVTFVTSAWRMSSTSSTKASAVARRKDWKTRMRSQRYPHNQLSFSFLRSVRLH